MEPRFLIAASAAAYFFIALGVHNLYPFSTFDMYSNRPMPSSSRVAVRDARGELGEVTEWSAWRCPQPAPAAPLLAASTDGVYAIDDLEHEAAAWLDGHRGDGAGGEPVSLVRHIWRFGGDGGMREEERTIAACRADRLNP